MRQLRSILSPIVYLASNWISLIGVILVTTGGILWVVLLPTFLRGSARDPYIGILQFMLLPGIFFAGLALIPVGIWWFRKRHPEEIPKSFPPLEFGHPRFRRLLAFLGASTVLNLVIGAQLSYRAVHYMESVSFCGQTCHVVMKPEFTAYQNSPHSRVDCVSCHIGPGANWFVKSKISGTWQVISVTFNLYERPIPTPVRELRPARETCEVCHWPQKFGGNRIRVVDTFADDQNSTLAKTVLLMKIGGGSGYSGIHGAHMGPGVVMRYGHEDPQRQMIPWVEYRKGDELHVYKAEGYSGDGPGALTVRTMDCMDCHNRPSHSFELPNRAIDHALSEGRIDRTLPFVKKTAMEIIQADYATTEDSEREIPARFAAFYQKNYPEVYSARKDAIDRSAQALLGAFSRNVFPEMRVKWGTYPNNIGHTDFTGCFRCHDERPSNIAGRTLTQDCDTCHGLLAMEEESPKVLVDLGMAPPAPTSGK